MPASGGRDSTITRWRACTSTRTSRPASVGSSPVACSPSRRRAASDIDEVRYREGDAFLFGRETSGLPAEILADWPQERLIRLPMVAGQPQPQPVELGGGRRLRGVAAARIRGWSLDVPAGTLFARRSISALTARSWSSASPVQRVTAVVGVMRMSVASCVATSRDHSVAAGARTFVGLAIRPDEPECAVIEDLDCDLSFMHQAMMEAAQGDEVGEFGLAPMGPVLHVMAVDVTLKAATGEAAAFVAGVQRSADGGRNSAGLSSNVERLAPLVLDDGDEAGIAGEPSRGFSRDRWAVFQLAAAGMAVLRGSRHPHAPRSAGGRRR